MEPLLRVVDLDKSFGANKVLKGVNLDVASGETITIIGPSGSGKTTLLRCINYLERPTSGHVYIEDRLIGEHWDGREYRHVGDRELAKERTEMGMVFQRFNLWPHLTALQNVTLGPLRVLRKPVDQAREEGRALLAKVDAILTSADDPPLPDVVASGSRALIRAWLDRKFTQWDEIKPYLVASYQAFYEPDVVEQTERWFEDAVGLMVAGLDRMGRFDPDRRRIRCVLAFGQLEYLSRRYFSVGWKVPREICLEELTDSWCRLLAAAE